ncbi:hypothetical protein HZB90_03250 [archaeon]|nr:hypothetical protein [archaeon]
MNRENNNSYVTLIEVDQSGKIEDLRQDTVVAFSNDKFSSIYLDRRIKREIFLKYRPRVRQIVQKMFSICLFYLLENHMIKKNAVIICTEYPGWEAFIKREPYLLLKRTDDDIVNFRSIGKKSRAHSIALLTNRQVLKPTKQLTEKDILKHLK